MFSICQLFSSWTDFEFFLSVLSALFWDADSFFSFVFFYFMLLWWITLIDFQMLCQPYILGINPLWSQCLTSSPYILLNIVFSCFIKGISVYVNERYWPIILFYFSLFVRFLYQDYTGFIKWIGICSFFSYILQEFV